LGQMLALEYPFTYIQNFTENLLRNFPCIPIVLIRVLYLEINNVGGLGIKYC